MKDSRTSNIQLPLGQETCKIDISGYSFDDYRTLNQDGYTILCNLGDVSDGLSFFPKTSKLVLNSSTQSELISSLNNFDQYRQSISEELAVTKETALEKYVDFFSTTHVTVQPTGVQGKLYNLMKSVQNIVPMTHTSQAVSILKTTGITGVQIITKSPLTFVGATYIGAIFFGYFGSVAGNNTIGSVFNSTSFVLSRPMKVVEITLNGIILRPISNVIGLPLILNGTEEIMNGKGLSIEEYTKIGIAFERISNSNVIQKAKKIYRIIRDKDE